MQIPRGGGGVIAPHPPYLFRDQQLSILRQNCMTVLRVQLFAFFYFSKNIMNLGFSKFSNAIFMTITIHTGKRTVSTARFLEHLCSNLTAA